MTDRQPVQAVFLDALGTTVGLKPPWPRLGELTGRDVDPGLAERAFRAEMAWYVAHSHEGTDAASLADLRRRAAGVLSGELGFEVAPEVLMEAIEFFAFPDAAPALAELRGRGIILVALSNWDCGLGEVLDRVGLGEHFDTVVTSASAGARKPDPEIFRRALAAAGCGAGQALHVGDTEAEDIAGAEAAGIRALLLDREGGGDIASLAEVADAL